MATRMRQSLAQFEAAFREEAAEERLRRERLRREAAKRSRRRRQQKVQKSGTVRFAVLVSVILATAAIVAIAMFQTLAILMG
ncbi:MAG: hypothetical protein IRZ21_10965 [Thermoleophilaceae bacterium]|nr:hypothetical protein [Thermoleophilaceae bacterium]